MLSRPALIVVSGPPGSGKTTLAHELARLVGCPAVCRDEIKEGMVHATPGFVPGPGDELSTRTLSTFFDVLELLLRAGVTTVAEAAFQDRLWRPGLRPLLDLADIRVVHCRADARVVLHRRRRRLRDNPLRWAHAERSYDDPAQHARDYAAFDRVLLDVPSLEVDTTRGYDPALDEIAAFASARRT